MDEIKQYREAIEQWARLANRIMDNAEVAQDYLGRVVDDMKNTMADINYYIYKREKGVDGIRPISEVAEKHKDDFLDIADSAYAESINK